MVVFQTLSLLLEGKHIQTLQERCQNLDAGAATVATNHGGNNGYDTGGETTIIGGTSRPVVPAPGVDRRAIGGGCGGFFFCNESE